MSNPIPTEITIGGKLPGDLLDELISAINEENLAFDWMPLRDGVTRAHILERIGKPLVLNDSECNYGDISGLTAFCEEHGLSYAMHVDADCEYDGECKWYTPDQAGPEERLSTQNGVPYFELNHLKLSLTEGKTLAEVVAMLTPPEIPPLEIVGEIPSEDDEEDEEVA